MVYFPYRKMVALNYFLRWISLQNLVLIPGATDQALHQYTARISIWVICKAFRDQSREGHVGQCLPRTIAGICTLLPRKALR